GGGLAVLDRRRAELAVQVVVVVLQVGVGDLLAARAVQVDVCAVQPLVAVVQAVLVNAVALGEVLPQRVAVALAGRAAPGCTLALVRVRGVGAVLGVLLGEVLGHRLLGSPVWAQPAARVVGALPG